MKKFAYLCVMMLISFDMTAQIDPYDRNWHRVFNDDFVGNSWNGSSWKIKDCNGTLLWRAFLAEWKSGVARSGIHSVYQKSPIHFAGVLPNDTVLRITATRESTEPMVCEIDYVIPIGKECDDNPDIPSLYYYSGNIETVAQFRFGYFEARCKLPIHVGSSTAFWLFGNSDTTYEEIDIFEYSQGDYNNDPQRGFSCGIWYNPDSTNYDAQTPNNIPHAQNLSKAFVHLPQSDLPVSEWHTYACEWMPDRIIWYCDGIVINECYDVNSIPKRAGKTMKLNYAIDKYAVYGRPKQPQWPGGASMSIDYARIYQLEWDCDTDVVISSNSDLDAFDYKVKGAIEIDSADGTVVVGVSDKVTLRASDYFDITGPFEVSQGGQFTVIRQDCPDD